MLRIATILFLILAFIVTSHESISTTTASFSNSTLNYTSFIANFTTKSPVVPGPNSTQTALYYAQFIVCVLVMVIGLFGNLLVIVIFFKRFGVLKTCEIFMISLAFADLIGTLTIPLDILRSISKVHDPEIGDFWSCQLSAWLGTTCISVSAITLVAIAVDRFIVVAWPLRSRGGSYMLVLCVIFFTWVIGGTFGILYLFRVRQARPNGVDYVCLIYYNSNGEKYNYIIALFVLQMVCPTIAMTFLYTFIVLKLRSGSVSARRLSETDNVTRIRTKRQRKATKLFIVVVIIFIVLVLPSNIFHILHSYGKIETSDVNYVIYVIVALLQASNSCVNPLIYSRLHKSFRRSTIALFLGCCIPKYYRYEWNSKFVSRTSYYRHRRGTDCYSTRYTNASFRKSASPYLDEGITTATAANTPPRPSSGLSSRSSRISSASCDEVFIRKSSLRVSFRKTEEKKAGLQQIPEQNGNHVDRIPLSQKSPSPEVATRKYVEFSNQASTTDNDDLVFSQEPITTHDVELEGMCGQGESNGMVFCDEIKANECNDINKIKIASDTIC